MKIKIIIFIVISLTLIGVALAGLDAGGGKVVNVAECNEPNDAANKAYVDANDNNSLHLTGGTVTGGVDFNDANFGGVTNYSRFDPNGDLSFAGTAGIVLPHLMQSDSTDQQITSAVEEQIINFNTDVHHAYITRIDANTFAIPKAGSYLVTFSAIAISADATPGKKIVIWMKKDGVNVADSATWYTFKSQNMNAIITVTFIYHFDVNDTFEFWMYGNDTDIKLLATAAVADSAGVTPAIPACPSIIMTCQYIGKD